MRLLDEKQAAYYLGMSTSFLRQSRCANRSASAVAGPPWLKIGRAVRYRTEDLNRWIEERRAITNPMGASSGGDDDE